MRYNKISSFISLSLFASSLLTILIGKSLPAQATHECGIWDYISFSCRNHIPAGTQSSQPRSSQREAVKVCNKSTEENIYVALATDIPESISIGGRNSGAENIISKGWWNVKRERCINIPVGAPSNNETNLAISKWLLGQGDRRSWSGENNRSGRDFCVHTREAFEYAGLEATRMRCNRLGQATRKFFPLGSTSNTATFNFE